MMDVSTTCMPAGFQSAPTSYFSPGLICPVGYVSACHDSTGIASVTTVTCCPAYDTEITLGCVDTDTLRGVWSTLFCTWLPPGNVTSLAITRTISGVTTTVTAGFTRSLRQGLNAFGVRMVYQTSDLVSPTAGPVADANPDAEAGGAPGLSRGGMVAVVVVVPVVVLAVAALLAFFWRRAQRRRSRRSDVAGHPPDGHQHPKPELTGTPIQPPVEMAHSGRQYSELIGSGVPCSPAVELPTSPHA